MGIQKESPQIDACLAAESSLGAEEAANLPGRLSRYSVARHLALGTCDYLSTQTGYDKLEHQIRGCANYLVFRDYYTVGKVRLHGMQTCRVHLLCPFCAIRRATKNMKAYLDRLMVIQKANPALKPFLVTLTVKNGNDLRERFKHLTDSVKAYHVQRREAYKGRRSRVEPCKAAGAVWSYEFTNKGKGWHPHMHAVWLCEEAPDQEAISQEWKAITGDSFVVDVTKMEEDPVKGFLEVFKYALKFSDLPSDLNLVAYELLKGKRLIGSFGEFRGVEIPEEMTDAPLGDELPFIELFYRFIRGSGYNLANYSAAPESA